MNKDIAKGMSFISRLAVGFDREMDGKTTIDAHKKYLDAFIHTLDDVTRLPPEQFSTMSSEEMKQEMIRGMTKNLEPLELPFDNVSGYFDKAWTQAEGKLRTP